ncbi:MAG: CrcB family protein [Actinobacteria bacterium]|nr:CrcB family protein [Actinomycetota bacterium]
MSARVPDADDAPGGRHALLAVLLGGMAGSALRLGVAETVPLLWATLAVNVAGALLLGVLYERLREHRLGRSGTWSALGPGLCGALTTFSALQFEAVELMRDGAWEGALLYLAASICLGLPAAALGRRLGRGGR